MKFFKWHILVTKTYVHPNGSTEVNVKFAKLYCKDHITQTEYLLGRIPPIKRLREAHRDAFGVPSSLKATKEWLDAYYDYNEVREHFNG